MKIFISWSGELSNQVAEMLNKWLPCIINSLEIFYSPDDIQKGENWDARITEELSECNFGIICLTKENVTSPWINFEAGAISKSFGSRISAFLIDINPSDVKGPLSRFQATRFNKNDFFKLIHSINHTMSIPVNSQVLENSFDVIWEKISEDIDNIIQKNHVEAIESIEEKNDTHCEDAIQEILQIVRDIRNNSMEKIYKCINDMLYNFDIKDKFKNNVVGLTEDKAEIMNNAYKKIVLEIDDLYNTLKSEMEANDNDLDKEQYISTLNTYTIALKSLSSLMKDEFIEPVRKKLDKCKEFLEIMI